MTLAELPVDTAAEVVHVDLADEEGGWLAAVGLEAGVRVRVLRRAVFGGPLHVATDDGEFAVAAALARAIAVREASREDSA